MRRLSKTVTLVGVTALTMPISVAAYAHDSVTTTTTTFEAPALDFRTPLNTEVYRAFLDAKLDKLAALADATRAKVAAIPGDTVLRGTARKVAKLRMARAARLSAILDAIPTTGAFAPTAAERARIAAIQADLDAIVAKLKMLLANEPTAVTPTTTAVKPAEDLKVFGTWFGHDCDGRHDGTGDWDGWRTWDGWRHHR